MSYLNDPQALAKYWRGFDHVTWYCGNAKQSAVFHIARMGFRPIARKQMQVGKNRTLTHEVIRNGNVTFEFVSPVRSSQKMSDASLENGVPVEEMVKLKEVLQFVEKHGDGVKDISWDVPNATDAWIAVTQNGAHTVMKPVSQSDEHGKVVMATVATFGDVTHTFVQRDEYKGTFLPGYQSIEQDDPLNQVLNPVEFAAIDHTVANQNWGEMDKVCDYYQNVFGFHQFISDDDYNVVTQYSALKSTVMASGNNVIKMPINEPAKGIRKSQIEEYLAYNNGPGIQHIALLTKDIMSCVTEMRRRGVKFIDVPDTYYEDLEQRMRDSKVTIKEDLQMIKKLNILVDFNAEGYLLQLFVKDHASNRPTVFYEIIQREGAQGFGGGNFRSLFEAIEREQAKRGNLL
ncbi:Glyoxalase/Bleomycin resistance protein/Dihydroxybiphenyl dioxygenase [Lipomyces japonicus]|uniref:Glyoxalase/Bleomycin resistance protein/Dihydroxybiphenyl dioxygenase n=1 Tax=Lipomyces japonicus TaxID=56871 RepID=UPI0034CF09C8